jgi:hypothetical protein
MHLSADSRGRWSAGVPVALASILVSCLVCCLASCTGAVERGPAGGGGDTPTPGGTVTPPTKPGMQPVAPDSVSAAVAPLRRLTRSEYMNTVNDLLGVTDVVAANSLPADDTINDRFHSNTITPVQTIDVGKYAEAADAIATKAVTALATLIPCAAQGDAACAAKFIDSFGKRAYRRPLTAAETAQLQMLYAAGGDFPTGIRLVITGLLQSPKFLYLPEPVPMNAPGKVVGVDGWALASRLSYFFLDTMPDEALFTAAEMGQLASANQVAAQATRLMADPRFRGTLFTFHQEWLQLDTLPTTEKDPMAFPQWTPALRDALGEETRRFVEYVFADGDRRLDTLLSAPFSFLDGTLAAHYGVAGGTPGTWQRVDLPKDQRAGLLTQAGLMATLAHENRTSFILRGKMVREALFCEAPLMPPADVPPEPKFDPMASAKARSEAHRKDPACASCHELFDPIGFAFEIYDSIGRYRTSDGAGPIDARVTLSQTAQLDGKTAANAVELVRLLAGADEVRDCVARQWLRFGLSRDDAKEDEPSLAAAVKAFKEGGAQLPALLVSIVRSDAFRFQKVPE